MDFFVIVAWAIPMTVVLAGLPAIASVVDAIFWRLS